MQARQRPHGFTLIELVITLAVAALLLTTVPAAMGKLLESARYHATVRDLLSDLRAARTRALLTGRAVHYVIDVNKRSVRYGNKQRQISDQLNFSAIVAKNMAQPDRAIVFYPDGSSSGGSLMLTRNSNGEGVRLRVDWLLARISQEPFHAS